MPDRHPASLCRGQCDAPRDGPMVRILFPPAASQQRIPSSGFRAHGAKVPAHVIAWRGLRNRWFADPSLKEQGFELLVPLSDAAIAKSRGSLRKVSKHLGGPAVRILLP